MRMEALIGLSLALACCGAPAHAETYILQELPLLPGEFVAAAAVKITDGGAVVGYCERADGTRERFLWLPAAMHGRAAGVHSIGEQQLYLDGEAFAISLNGVWAGGGGGEDQAFLWTPASGLQFLDPLSAESTSVAIDVNNFGFSAGFAQTGQIDAGGTESIRGVTWDPLGNAFVLQPATGSLRSRADGINDAGVVVGSSGDLACQLWPSSRAWGPAVSTDEVATVWRNGVPIDLNLLLANDTGWVLEAATDINNYGQMVGIGVSPTGQRRAFLLTPAGGDYNGDELNDNQDLLDFLSDYAEAHPAADFTGDSNIDPADFEAFLGGGYDVEPGADALAWEENGCEFVAMMVVTDAPTASENVSELCQPGMTLEQWLACPECWNKYHPKFNRPCYGCSGADPNNPHRPNGAPGYPGDSPYNPYAPNGGPGGPGDDGGDGGDGGNADEGGNGGDGGAGGEGGDGGDGGDGGNGDPQGGDGGNGGAGGPDGGSGGDGGKGGDGIGNGSSGGKGGNGGNGTDGYHNGTNPGGSGGSGGDGGNGQGSGSGGEGGSGGNGGKGSNGGTGPTGAGGSGGPGGQGGNGGFSGGNGGPGGNGGTGGPGGNSGGDGGNGGPGGGGGEGRGSGADGGKGGNGGNGASGGGSPRGGNGGNGGSGGNGGNGHGSPGGTGGNGGNGGNGGAAGAGNSSSGSGGAGGSGGGGHTSGSSGSAGTP